MGENPYLQPLYHPKPHPYHNLKDVHHNPTDIHLNPTPFHNIHQQGNGFNLGNTLHHIVNHIVPISEEEENLFSLVNIDFKLTSIFLIILVTIMILIEMLFKWIHEINSKDQVKRAFLHLIKVEMFVLGFISFARIIAVEVCHFTGSIFKGFEFCHMWVFLFGLNRIVHCAAGYNTSTKINDLWTRAETEDLNELIKFKYKPRWGIVRILYGPSMLGMVIEYNILRFLFLKHYQLSSKNFHFSMYINEASKNSIIDRLQNPRISSWIAVNIVVVIYTYILAIDPSNPFHDLMVSLVASSLNAAVSLILMGIAQNGIEDFIDENHPGPRGANTYMDFLKILKKNHEEEEKAGHVHTTLDEEYIRKKTKKSILQTMITSLKVQMNALQHLDTLFKRDTGHPFFLGMNASTVLFWTDLFSMIQSFSFGFYLIVSVKLSLQLLPVYLAVPYNLFICALHLFIVLISCPRTLMAISQFQNTHTVDYKAFVFVKDRVELLNRLRKEIIVNAQEKFPDEDKTIVFQKAWSMLYTSSSRNVWMGYETFSKHQLGDLLKHVLDLRFVPRECTLIIEAMDLDRSGSIEKSEFINFLEGYHEEEMMPEKNLNASSRTLSL